MVQNAYKVTLVSCIVPLAAGIYWKRANNAGRDVVGAIRSGCPGQSRSSPRRKRPSRRNSSASLSRSSAWSWDRSCRAPASAAARRDKARVAARADSCSRRLLVYVLTRLRDPLPDGRLARPRGIAVRLPCRAVAAPHHVLRYGGKRAGLRPVRLSRRCRRCSRACGVGGVRGGHGVERSRCSRSSSRRLQSYLPARFAVQPGHDVQLAGGRAGSRGRRALWTQAASRKVFSRACAQRAFLPGGAIDLGLALMGLWLLIQLNPTSLLFGAGDLRELLGAARAARRAPGVLHHHRGAARRRRTWLRPACCFRPSRRRAARLRVQFAALVGAALIGEDSRVRDPDARRERVRLAHARRPARPRRRDRDRRAPRLRCRAPLRLMLAARAAHGRDRARESRAAQPVSRRFAEGLAAGALPELQRPHAPGERAVALRRARVPDVPRGRRPREPSKS